MKLTEENVATRFAITRAEFDDFRKEQQDLGFRMRSLSISGWDVIGQSEDDLRYTFVMFKEENPASTRTFPTLSASEYDAKLAVMKKEGFGAQIVSATGPSNGAVYAAVFRKTGRFPFVQLDMSADDFAENNLLHHDKGRILISADAFGGLVGTRYCAVWDRNVDSISWSAEALDLKNPEKQQMFEAMRSARARPAIVSITPGGGAMHIYVDSRTGKWESRSGLSLAKMKAMRKSEAKEGRFPTCISAFGTGNTTVFSAIFDTQSEPQARSFKAMGTTLPTASSDVVGIDTEVEAFIKKQNLRGAAFAIVRDSRLVFARGYSFAEPDYPAITPETRFRLASVSKTFCAVGIWRLIQKQQLSLTDNLQTLFPVKQKNGDPPADSDFAKITLQHLLESCSGIDQGSVRAALEDWRDSSRAQPVAAKEIVHWIASHDLVGVPGTRETSVYGNTDYFLLGQILAKKVGKANFFDALKQIVLDPLEMTRTSAILSRKEDHTADEAPYHLTAHTRDKDGNVNARHLQTGISMVHSDRRIVAYQYGAYNNTSGSGSSGLSSSVIDIARLCALFSSTDPNNPVLSPGTIDDMLSKAACATEHETEDGDHGYHGFDGVTFERDANDVRISFAASKGGSIQGVRASFKTGKGRTWLVFAYNGNPGDVATKGEWFAKFRDAASKVTWGTGDLFPTYGLSPIRPEEFK